MPNKKSHFNINNTKLLKEFIIDNPPDFAISNKCCKGAKKDTAHKYMQEHKEFDCECMGLRRAEGGIRSSAYKSCFSEYDKVDQYRPLFWWVDNDKTIYDNYYNIQHSKCYSEYGFTRTGCSCCVYGSKFEEELEIVKQHEPQLYKAVCNIFGKSYEYTRKYREYKKLHSQKGILNGQTSMFDKKG